MGKKSDPDKILEAWVERDLTAAVAEGDLPPAFEVDDSLQRIEDVLESGHHPVISGEPGVGKTAIVYELMRRLHAGHGPRKLRGRRVLQLSLRHRAAGLVKADQIRPEMQKLVEVLLARDEELALFFRDFHRAWDFDLEPQFQLLGYRFRGPILAEGNQAVLRSMFENSPELEQHYLVINRDEPRPETMERVLTAWAEHQRLHYDRQFEPTAQTMALELTHRFLARDRLPRKAVDLLQQVGSLSRGAGPVTEGDVIERFCRNFNVPRILVDPAIRFDLREVEARFRHRVLGQDEAVRAVVRLVGLIKAGLSDMRRPFGALLFVGPTGVGKTHIAQLLAEYLFGSTERLVRFNMADYQQERDALVLFGDPEGYLAPLRRGQLHQRLWGHPFAVVLLDEFEKAHAVVHDRFLQLMDEGAFINGAGETVPCRSMILIATSNAGAEVYRQHAVGFTAPTDTEALDRELDRRLAAKFRFEFLNRLDDVVHFHPLSRAHIRTIALRELEALKQRVGFRNRQLELEVDEAVLDWLAVHGYDPQYGARFLRRTIERTVTTVLAETIVLEQPEPGGVLGLSVRGRDVAARLVRDPGASEAKRQAVTLPEGTTERTRSLDRRALLAESETLLQRAAPLLAALAQRREEASALLSQMNEPTFWDGDEGETRDTLERYRELDLLIQLEGRFARTVQWLEETRERARDDPRGEGQKRLARALEAAAEAMRDWEERRAEQGPGAVWLLVRSVDPLHPASDWIEQLVQVELAWCQRLHLSAQVVAYGLAEDTLARAVLEVEGPGAALYLAMEDGLHRLSKTEGRDDRAQVQVVERSGAPAADDRVTLRTLRSRPGPFDLTAAAAAQITLPHSGQVLELYGEDDTLLRHLVTDLHPVLAAAPAEPPPPARLYASGGAGARDPRTGAVTPRLKDALRGKLDPFLEAWRRRDPTDQPSAR